MALNVQNSYTPLFILAVKITCRRGHNYPEPLFTVGMPQNENIRFALKGAIYACVQQLFHPFKNVLLRKRKRALLTIILNTT